MASRGAALPPRSGPRDLAAVAGLIFSIVMVLVVLLFRSAGAVGSAELLFPAWITILSLYLFIKDPGGQPRTQPQTQA